MMDRRDFGKNALQLIAAAPVASMIVSAPVRAETAPPQSPDAPGTDKSKEAAGKKPGADKGKENNAKSPATNKSQEASGKSPGSDKGREDMKKSPGADKNREDTTKSPGADKGKENTSKSPGLDKGKGMDAPDKNAAPVLKTKTEKSALFQPDVANEKRRLALAHISRYS